jgi:GNAT superfamily N-acetyltransferase
VNEDPILRVVYMELREPPASLARQFHSMSIAIERLARVEYLALYRQVGEQVRWDQRLQLSAAEIDALLGGERLDIYVLRNEQGDALGFCEFDTRAFPQIELKHFGLVPEAQGRGLGSWLLSVALQKVWQSGAARIWLHTDNWDHPAAIRLYERAGFQVYAVRDEAAAPL